jgi:hypothetical protein
MYIYYNGITMINLFSSYCLLCIIVHKYVCVYHLIQLLVNLKPTKTHLYDFCSMRSLPPSEMLGGKMCARWMDNTVGKRGRALMMRAVFHHPIVRMSSECVTSWAFGWLRTSPSQVACWIMAQWMHQEENHMLLKLLKLTMKTPYKDVANIMAATGYWCLVDPPKWYAFGVQILVRQTDELVFAVQTFGPAGQAVKLRPRDLLILFMVHESNSGVWPRLSVGQKRWKIHQKNLAFPHACGHDM